MLQKCLPNFLGNGAKRCLQNGNQMVSIPETKSNPSSIFCLKVPSQCKVSCLFLLSIVFSFVLGTQACCLLEKVGFKHSTVWVHNMHLRFNQCHHSCPQTLNEEGLHAGVSQNVDRHDYRRHKNPEVYLSEDYYDITAAFVF